MPASPIYGWCSIPSPLQRSTPAPLLHQLAEPQDGPKAKGSVGVGEQQGPARLRDAPWDPGLPILRAEWETAPWEPGASLFFTGRGAFGETEAVQHTPTPRKSPLPSQGSRMPLLPLPQPPGKVGGSLPGRGGQARLGVGLWRPGPGTQQRKFQAATPGCL